MKRFFQRIIDAVRRKPKHPAAFIKYVKQARYCIMSQKLEAPDGRRTLWHLAPGRPITSFGERDYVFNFRGQEVLGVAVWGDPIRIHLGSDGKGHYNRHTALHEGGHVPRMQVGDFGHHPKLRACFQGWSDTGYRLPQPVGEPPEDGGFAIVDYPNGEVEVCPLTREDKLFLDHDLSGLWYSGEEAANPMYRRPRNWKYMLDSDRSRQVSWIPPHVRLHLEWMRVEEGMMTAFMGYAWDGCSPTGPYWDTWDGTMEPLSHLPLLYWASLWHDIVYQYIREIAEAMGVSVWTVRRYADRDFLRDGKEAGFKLARTYYGFVRAFGWIPVWRRLRRGNA